MDEKDFRKRISIENAPNARQILTERRRTTYIQQKGETARTAYTAPIQRNRFRIFLSESAEPKSARLTFLSLLDRTALAGHEEGAFVDLYSIGEMVIDFTPGSEPHSYIRNAGGAPANLAIAFAKNGLEAGMCCSLGDDDFGRFLRETLAENHVMSMKPQLCERAVTTMAFVTLADDGDRSFTFARKPGADMFIEPEDVREEDIADSVIVHAGSCSLSASPCDAATMRAMELGKKAGKLVSFDLNYRDLMWDSPEDCIRAVRRVLPNVDLMKISAEEADMLGGEEQIDELMKENGIAVVVETLGSGGARCWFEGESFESAAPQVNCVDATAAGDAFWGGFLSYLRMQGIEKTEQITRKALEEALKYGNASGALCVQTMGAICALPTRDQVEALLADM